MSEIVLELPDKLAKEAKASGLLRPESIASLLKAELRRRRINKMFEVADRSADSEKPFTEDDVNIEINAYRANKNKR